METTFYEESDRRGGKSTGRPLTLDLNSLKLKTATRKQTFCILTSPDMKMLKMSTPEIEKFIMENGGNMAVTPVLNGHQIIITPVTEEKENYPRGFTDALNQLHQHQLPSGHQDNMTRLYSGLLPIYLPSPGMTSVIKSPLYSSSVLANWNPITARPSSVEDSNSSFTNSSFTNSSCSNSNSVPMEFATKEELQTVPSGFSSPPISPISKDSSVDMADQEQIKLEKKRYRNRIAARKCRQRKDEKISLLEDKVKELEGENANLRQQVCHFKELEEENANLRQQVCHFKELEEENANLRQQVCHFRELEGENANLQKQVCHYKENISDHLQKGCKIVIHHPL